MTYRRCIICEKPALAREIAGALSRLEGGGIEKHDGYLTVGQDVVTWFFGHMFQQAMPSEYGPKWANFSDLSSLPVVIPSDGWIMKVSEGKEKQVKTIRDLTRQSEIIVNCGDAGREGQLLIDEALHEWKIDPFGGNVLRIWSQDLTEGGLRAALQGMAPNAERRNLSYAALARSRADFQHGMTYSQLYTVLARNAGARVTISVGRVQTPTLKLVVMRDRERAHFKPVSHFLPKVTFVHANGTFQASWVIPDGHDGLDTEGRLVDKAQAEKICALVNGKAGSIATATSDLKSQVQPLPFSLAGLQGECGRKLSLTAAETLAIAQSLYEKKVTSYPRTDSAYLPTEMRETCAPIVASLGKVEELSAIASGVDMTIRSPAWNDSKITDHYGIVPTAEFTAAKFESLSDVEKSVFILVARQFLAQFYPAFQYKAMRVEVACEGQTFRATGRQILRQGWKDALSRKVAEDPEDRDPEDEDDKAPVLPDVKRGDAVQANGHEVASMKTTPPPAYNDPRLAGEGGAMEKAYLFETDPEIRKRLKEGDGIGRPATRASIIEVLLRRGFLKRKGKIGLESTELGRSVIDALPPQLCSVGLTAMWETALGRIEDGSLTLEKFLESQANSLRTMVAEALKSPDIVIRGIKGPVPLPGDGKTCEKCGKGIMRTREWKSKTPPHQVKKALFCSDRTCGNAIWDAHIKALPGDGKKCPECGEGIMKTKEVTSKKDGKKYTFLSCNNYPKCRHSEFPDDGKKGGKAGAGKGASGKGGSRKSS